MENKTYTWQIIVGLVVVALLAFILIKSPKSEVEENNNQPVAENPNVNAMQLCYIWNTEAGDKAQLSMDIRGEDVIGEFNWLPAEKDKKTGIFKGKVSPLDQKMMARTVNAWWEVSAEGMTATEELKIIFGEGTANVGFGEMKDRGDGTYVYANPDKLSYEPNLSQTDCGDEAMD